VRATSGQLNPSSECNRKHSARTSGAHAFARTTPSSPTGGHTLSHKASQPSISPASRQLHRRLADDLDPDALTRHSRLAPHRTQIPQNPRHLNTLPRTKRIIRRNIGTHQIGERIFDCAV
jgi:hypothetical protein